MKKTITMVDLNEMEEEIFHYYLCIFMINGISEVKSNYSYEEKKLILTDAALNKKYHDDSISLSGYDFVNMLVALNQIKQNFSAYSPKENTEVFKKFMQNYERMIVDTYFVLNPKIKNKIKGIRGMRIRYEQKLYPKLNIFYALLREKVAQQGQWPSVNAAIREILPELKLRFFEYDQQQIKNTIASNETDISDCEEALKQPENAEIFKYDKRHEYQKHLNRLKYENIELRKLLELDASPYALKKKSPFNTIYIDEVLMNNLRRNKKLLDEVIICNKK
ncbi:hypothetical protein [Acinetobacter sp. MD2(2019)]|uniref:hypothetical protein n=1 Tax=Acinetobacter sp. MD2(2019) TaxID=2605273 RepID=UPI002D1E933A|nr:hypothetical protein [Acinetobacter sp. MD2(2019)]MEB3755186.1 hypothetical protein [Acinetobacter sp. MD2(2019)]